MALIFTQDEPLQLTVILGLKFKLVGECEFGNRLSDNRFKRQAIRIVNTGCTRRSVQNNERFVQYLLLSLLLVYD